MEKEVFFRASKYTTPDGKHTCCLKFGSQDICVLTGDNLHRGHDENGEPTGYLIPSEDCPLRDK